jgi:hypothetical protein
MKNIVTFLFTLMAVGLLGAQNNLPNDKDYGPQCGTDIIIERNPFLQQLYASRACSSPEVNLDTAQVLTLPLVVHVVHLGEPVGEGSNISDEQILSMVENLNHRFRGDTEALSQLLNGSDNIAYDEYELSLAKDSKIEFCMAQRDPNNEPTNGIVRHNGSNLVNNGESYAVDGVSPNALESGISDSWMKSTLGCWNTEQYFNIWVVTEIGGNNGGGGIQGYSYIGHNPNNCDSGPVLLYNIVGTTGNIKLGNIGATTAHEMGHALGLYHTFYNTFSCGGSESSCTNGDYIPDTPSTTTNFSCTFSECEGALTQNYMDYTSQDCRTAFTQNQIERMRDEIWTEYSGLINFNYNCQSLSNNDLAITGVYGFPESWCQDAISFSIKINNLGSEDATGATLLINGTPEEIPTIIGGSFVTLEFTNYPLGNGAFNFEIVYEGDEYPSNNTAFESVIVENSSLLELAITTEFFAQQNTYTLTDEFGNVLLDEGGFGAGITTRYYELCIPDGCYTLTLYDDGGNGWQFGGEYTITVNGEEISSYASAGSWSEYSEQFCVEYNCELETASCPWDLNSDNRVNIQDVMSMLMLMGQDVAYCTSGDFNFDQLITHEDLDILLENYGAICTNGLIQNKSLIVKGDSPQLVGSPLYFDIQGKQVRVTSPGDLSGGIYLVVENWSDNTQTIKKILINPW